MNLSLDMKIKSVFFTLLSSFCISTAYATGATVTIHPAVPTSVPTLSGMMLIVLSLLLFVVTYKIAKQKNNPASKFFIALLGVSALVLGSGGGFKLVSEVQARTDTEEEIPIVPVASDHFINIGGGYEGFLKNQSGRNLTVSIKADSTSRCVIIGVTSDLDIDTTNSCGDTYFALFEDGGGTQPNLGNQVVSEITMVPDQICYLLCDSDLR